MLRNKSFTLLFFVVVIFCISLLPAFNYLLDRYRVFNALHKKFDTYYWRTDNKWEYNHNDRFIPMAYLLKTKHKFDSFLLGNSKLSTLDTSRLGSNWYKLNYNSGNIEEHLHNTKVLANSINVKEIVLAVDDQLFFFWSKNQHYKTMLFPDSLQEWLIFFIKYLFKRPDEKDINLWFGKNYKLTQRPENYIRTTVKESPGLRVITDSKKLKEHDTKIRDMQLENRYRFFIDNRTEKILQLIKELKKIAENKGIRFRIYFQPLHYKNLYRLDYEKLLAIKYKLATIIDYIDFSFPHNYLFNNAYWREPDHFQVEVSNEIAKKLKLNRTSCSGFGVNITEKNVTKVLQEETSLYAILLEHLNKLDVNINPDKYFSDINISHDASDVSK